jgi:hypothetical protein
VLTIELTRGSSWRKPAETASFCEHSSKAVAVCEVLRFQQS